MPSNNLYGFPQPLSQVFPPPIEAARAPLGTDIQYPIGQMWMDTLGNDAYILTDVTAAVATWAVVAVSSGTMNTLTGNSGGAVVPSAGNVNVLGTGVLAFSGAGATLTGSITPGTVLISTITGGTGGARSPAAGNFNILGTASQITSTGAGSTITLSTPAAFIAPGSIAATTTLTATLGAITATNGNLVLTAAGNKMVRSSVGTTTAAGANSIGSVTLVGGTATIATTSVTAASLIKLWRQSIGATGATALGMLTIGTITAGVSFVLNAAQSASASSLQASDVSVVGWEIIN